MADEQIGIEVEVNGIKTAIKDVNDYKKAIEALEKTTDNSDFGSDEFAQASKELENLKKKTSEIAGTETAKLGSSITELKKRFKELKVELSNASDPKEFARLSKELNDVEGQLGDMNDAANLATGSGVEQLNKGFGLLREGFANFDFDKIKIGFKGIGNAMSAAVPFLLVEVISLVVQNFDEIKKVALVLFPALDSVSQSTKNLEKEQTKLIAANKIAINTIENELRVLEASGASQGLIIQKKRDLIALKIKELEADTALQKSRVTDIIQNDSLIEGSLKLEASVLRKIGNDKKADEIEKFLLAEKFNRSKEFTDKIKENELSLANLKTDLTVAEIENDKKVKENYTKSLEDKEKRGEENYRKYKEQVDAIKQAEIDAANEESVIIPEIKQQQALTEIEIEKNKNAALLNESALKAAAELEQDKKLQEQKSANRTKLEQDSFNAAKGLSDALFSIQIGNAEKGSAKERELRKKQFEVDKAFSLTRIFQDGVRSVQANLALGPYGIPLAIVAGTTATANFAKVAASKFDGGSSGNISAGSGSGSAPSGNIPTPPTISTPQNNVNTLFDAQGNTIQQAQTQRMAVDITGKVTVTENDITTIQNRSNKLKVQTTF